MLTEKIDGLLRRGRSGKQFGEQETKFDATGVLNVGAKNADIDPELAAGLGNQRRIDRVTTEAQAQ